MQLVKSPDPWLQTKVAPFDFDKLNAKEISDEMINIMEQNQGLGLSANQVGLDAQIFVMVQYMKPEVRPVTIINPVIESVTANTEQQPEGCLSHDLLFFKVTRPRGVIVSFVDIDNNPCTLELYDIDARCFLHEYDHLQGIQFTDRVSKLRLDRAKIKQKKLRKLKHG
jgi:peptide deformylase